MINKIKSVLQTESLIKTVIKSLKEQNQHINTLGSEVSDLRKKISEYNKTACETNAEQKAAQKSLSKVTKLVALDQEKLHQAVNEFNIQKSKAAQKIVEQLRTDIAHFTDVLRTDVHSFDRLKSEVDSITTQLDQTKAEIARFVEISRRLKSSDFEMTKYIRKVQEMDGDKLQLMKKIDSLERLVARQRRDRS